ncbi:Charged multivesicular body protein 4b [Hondaea fermentalgiana]|uniref:Charged multivesicular body protein 4b n=1 Tax=Hondaea fermentalgiana TaxID=2315210 RepID=A0A2R5GKS9_9STRA|nr:Charged multivesicular body protein 4b [Hondaea fermentalgiana]|eukprot:GBG30919.1 Charged multivesicular body protein 4b [Hondaea fermentalgiana]
MGNDKSKAARGPAPAKQPTVSRTVDQAAQMKQTVQRLEARRDFLDKKADQELKLAKLKNKKGDKKGALAHLKRKKMYEKEVVKINNGVMNLEQQILTLESSSVTVDIVQAMKTGRNAMQSVQASVNPDDVAELQDDIAELQQQQDEIDDVIGAPMGFQDDGELEDELAELEAAGLEEELDELPSVPVGRTKKPAAADLSSLPAAPTSAVSLDDDDAALKELEAEMAA